jgi:hypothetical protein
MNNILIIIVILLLIILGYLIYLIFKLNSNSNISYLKPILKSSVTENQPEQVIEVTTTRSQVLIVEPST